MIQLIWGTASILVGLLAWWNGFEFGLRRGTRVGWLEGMNDAAKEQAIHESRTQHLDELARRLLELDNDVKQLPRKP